MPEEVSGKNILAIYSNTNTHGKHDATGAFIPEARKFCKLYEVPIENTLGVRCPRIARRTRRKRVLEFIKERGEINGDIDAIAFFCHGWPKGIQFGFGREHIPELTDVVRQRCVDRIFIPIFACLTAENDERDKIKGEIGPATDGGFADLLRDSLEKAGIKRGWVDAHKTAGHATWNPYVIRFLMDSTSEIDENGIGGSWLVGPRSQLWKQWKRSLKNDDLRYRFPFMSELEIKMELADLS